MVFNECEIKKNELFKIYGAIKVLIFDDITISNSILSEVESKFIDV